MSPTISIVMAYYNRKTQLLKTLQSISESAQKDIEIIIIDDCSLEDQKISNTFGNFGLRIEVVEIDKKNRWWVNPCIPFNMGFKKAKGDIIVIQNPECIHIRDVLDYTVKHINDKTYLCFACLGLGMKGKISPLNDEVFKQRITNGNVWYCHSKFRSWAPHFTAAITRENLLNKLGGFDERYAKGIGYDDMEFYQRVKRFGLNILIPNPEEFPFVIHQYHPRKYGTGDQRNSDLYHNITLQESVVKVN